MGRLFEQRERAAEGLFVHDQEARFVAHRRGFETLAAWAGESMELDADARAAYVVRLVDAYVSGVGETEIVAAVQTDLERAGKPTLTGQAALILSQAIAEATAAAHEKPAGVGRERTLKKSSKPFLGWSL